MFDLLLNALCAEDDLKFIEIQKRDGRSRRELSSTSLPGISSELTKGTKYRRKYFTERKIVIKVEMEELLNRIRVVKWIWTNRDRTGMTRSEKGQGIDWKTEERYSKSDSMPKIRSVNSFRFVSSSFFLSASSFSPLYIWFSCYLEVRCFRAVRNIYQAEQTARHGYVWEYLDLWKNRCIIDLDGSIVKRFVRKRESCFRFFDIFFLLHGIS